MTIDHGRSASPSGHSQAEPEEVSALRASVPNAAFLLKSWDVTVEGYGVERIVASSRGKALAKAWRCDAFNRLTFGDFLKVASAWRAMLVNEGFGEPILVQGRPAFRVGRHCSYVSFAWPWSDTVLNAHPSNVAASAIEARRAATEDTGAVHESAVGNAETPNTVEEPLMDKGKLVELAEFWEKDCNRYVNGECQSRGCLLRGGWEAGPPDYSLATCPAHETAAALRSHAQQP